MEIGIIKPVRIEDEMERSYLDYAMSVIVARALPDVRDGLKPSQRRILVAMHDLNLAANRPHRKCAKIAGDTSGNYHPHGEAVIYPTLVRMAQEFNMRYPLVDGQGNFGSMDNDPPAAMRYTEARLTPIALEMLADIDMDTVDWLPNYDNTRQEPTTLPGRFPNLICNGSAGIAVGMATSIPPHNLTEVVTALLHLIEHPDATVEDLCAIIPGPDFPTGGIILGDEDIKKAYASGHGRVLLRARTTIEEPRSGRYQIVVTELPYQTNKAALQERIADLVRDKKIDGISDMRDESDRQGMRLVIEVKRDARPQTLLKQLFKHTAMQTAISMNMLALTEREVIQSDGTIRKVPQPEVLTLKRLLTLFLGYRQEVLTRRTQFELDKAKARAHILEGLKIALDHVDAIIRLIRAAASADAAREQLMQRYKLSDIQARAILDLQLRRLAALERQEILDEYAKLLQTIERLEDLLANPIKILYLVRDELIELRKKYGDARRTMVAADQNGDISDEDIIPNIDVLVTISSRGYIKRLPSGTYRAQRRGGKGIKGMVLREEDALRHMIACKAHDNILFFTDRGRVFQLKAHVIPEADRTAKGLPVVNLISIDPNETVTAVLAAPDFEHDFLMMATRQGEIKKTPLKDFAVVRSNGLIAFDLEASDELAWVKHCSDNCELLLVTEQGQSLRFRSKDVTSRSRQAGGMRGIRLGQGDRVCGLEMVEPNSKFQLLVVTANGYGKRTDVTEYPQQGRGGSGVRTTTVTDKTGPLAAARVIHGDEELMVISSGGTVLRTTISSIRETGRTAQGVQIIGLRGSDHVACIAIINGNDED